MVWFSFHDDLDMLESADGKVFQLWLADLEKERQETKTS
jgi:hypothetical protein